MSVLGWLLVHGAEALRWLGGAILALLGSFFSALDRILNPVLSPLLAAVNPLCTALGDGVYAVLRPLPIGAGLTLLSAIAGVVMLIAFRYTSNQKGIGQAKDAMKANLLALKLFKDELRVTFVSQWRLLRAVGKLQRHMFTPILIMALPMLLGIAQMGIRHQWRPLKPGEQALIKVKLKESKIASEIKAASENIAPAKTVDVPISAVVVTLEPSPGLVIEMGPVPGGGEAAWRVRGAEAGGHVLHFRAGGQTLDKQLVIGDSFERVSAERVGKEWTAQLLHPVEPPLPKDSPIQGIEILYPLRDSSWFGADWWVLTFFIISMIAALIFAPLFKVRF